MEYSGFVGELFFLFDRETARPLSSIGLSASEGAGVLGTSPGPRREGELYSSYFGVLGATGEPLSVDPERVEETFRSCFEAALVKEGFDGECLRARLGGGLALSLAGAFGGTAGFSLSGFDWMGVNGRVTLYVAKSAFWRDIGGQGAFGDAALSKAGPETQETIASPKAQLRHRLSTVSTGTLLDLS